MSCVIDKSEEEPQSEDKEATPPFPVQTRKPLPKFDSLSPDEPDSLQKRIEARVSWTYNLSLQYTFP